MDFSRFKKTVKPVPLLPWWFKPFTLSVIGAAVVSFLAWGPARWFLFSFIPDNAESGWVIKLIITIIVGGIGGTAIPIVLIIFGIKLWSELPSFTSGTWHY